MRQDFSTKWKSSKQPRKQRKYRANAPLHIKGKFLHAHLDEQLRKKHGLRSVRLVKGDKVKICRGDGKGKSGEVERVEVARERIFVQGIERNKMDGSRKPIPVNPSNVKIEELNTKHKRRFMKEIKEAKGTKANEPKSRNKEEKKENDKKSS